MNDKEKVSLCPGCGHAMVWSFALFGKEWVCVPCAIGLPMYNDACEEYRSTRALNRKRDKWAKDLHVAGLKFGGGRCPSEVTDKPCAYGICPDVEGYEFQYWGKNVTQTEEVA